jgi:hypothetical protein
MPLINGQVVRPSASAIIDGTKVSPDTVTISLSLNTFPNAQVRFHDAGATDRVSSAVPEDMSSKVARDQTAMFKGKRSSTVRINDGTGNSLELKGYIANTQYDLTVGGIGQVTSIIHECAILDTLDTHIYTTKPTPFRNYPDLPTGGEKYGTWLSKVLVAMIRAWYQNYRNVYMPGRDKAVEQEIHLSNQEGSTAWLKVCTQSTASNAGIGKIMGGIGAGQLKIDLCTKINELYLNSYGSFFNTIQQFCAQFQMIFVPSVSDDIKIGYFISLSEVTQVKDEKEVNIRQMVLAAGSEEILPVHAVVISGAPKNIYKNGLTQGQQGAGMFAPAPALLQFPAEPATGGRLQRMGCPAWLSLTALPIRNTAAAGAPKLSEYARKRSGINAKQNELLDNDVREILTEYASNHYIDMTLSGSTVQLTTPLDVSWKIGQAYAIRTMATDSEASKLLFEGFLYGVEHTVSSNQQSPEAGTRLFFTHVQAGDFVLPGLESGSDSG